MQTPAPRVERRLVAVMAADVVGYSRLVERDERGTLARLEAVRRQLLEPLLAAHQGRLFKLMGDGLLAAFGSVVDAVGCAVAIQRALGAHEAAMPEALRLCLRIGVNLGDVVEADHGDLLGEGVIIAARLQALAEPAGILVSGTVFDHLQGKLDCGLEGMGERRLKNIDRPIRVFRLVLDGAASAHVPAATAADRPVVAVLPFDNLSGDQGQAYFTDGISEDIITELSRFCELLVIARNSSFAWRGKAVDVREVGRGLGASHVVEGSVRRAVDRVRITAQLIDAATGVHLWAERYDRQLSDVFAVQDEIARAIVVAVARRVLDVTEAVARRREPRDVRAYDLFLQGLRLSDQFTGDAQERAKGLFRRAIAIDPGFARAYTGLAFNRLNHTSLVRLGVPRRDDPDCLEALRLAEQALALDPNDPRVHLTLGQFALIWHDFDRAARHLDLAQAMNPNDANIQISWALGRACLGEAERGLPACDLALQLNPQPPRWYDRYRSRILFLARRHEEALVILERLTATTPLEHPRDLGWRAAAAGLLRRTAEAEAAAGLFRLSISRLWRGDPAADGPAHVDWLVDAANLRRPEDEALLRDGLRCAGLPA